MREEFFVLMFFFGISMTTNVALAIAVLRANRRVKRLEDLHDGPALTPLPAPRDDRRADRIEQAVEALAGQVDQLASGQEFLNRVIAERLDRVSRALPVLEPHETPN